jgi:hypothetical protein
VEAPLVDRNADHSVHHQGRGDGFDVDRRLAAAGDVPSEAESRREIAVVIRRERAAIRAGEFWFPAYDLDDLDFAGAVTIS